jgi:hypothetical protein
MCGQVMAVSVGGAGCMDSLVPRGTTDIGCIVEPRGAPPRARRSAATLLLVARALALLIGSDQLMRIVGIWHEARSARTSSSLAAISTRGAAKRSRSGASNVRLGAAVRRTAPAGVR